MTPVQSSPRATTVETSVSRNIAAFQLPGYETSRKSKSLKSEFVPFSYVFLRVSTVVPQLMVVMGHAKTHYIL